MSGSPRAQKLAERIIGGACRRLPGEVGTERYREWTAELPAILHDPDVRAPLLRTVRMLRYAAGAYRSSRQLRVHGAAQPSSVPVSLSGGWATRSRRHPLVRPAFPDGVIPAIAAVALWVTVVVVIRLHPPVGFWNVVGIAGGIGSEVLAVIAIVRFVRWARRRSKRTPRP